ncbi:MAG: phospholipase D family protein [Candidatus Omnitrophica bacterium]|nr:phospholipase D family protein [Candidatus Omnitrophota bacterium]
MKRRAVLTSCLGICLILSPLSCSYRTAGVTQPMIPVCENLHVSGDIEYPASPCSSLIKGALENRTHYVTVLDNGDDALLARAHLIRNAQQTILIQTFIWGADESGRFLFSELIQAAKRGVKVRILIDALGLPAEPRLIAFLTAVHPNIEIKFYNPVSDKVISSKLALLKKASLDFSGLNQRMHNKIFVVDDRFGITGGRNYENDYFDRGRKRNFRDCDVLVIGPVVRDMTDSFMEYWSFDLSVPSGDMLDVRTLIERGEYTEYSSKESFELGRFFGELERRASDTSSIQRLLVDPSHGAGHVSFIADHPGKRERIGKRQIARTTYELGRFLLRAEKSLVVQTPYLVVDKKNARYFKKLARSKPDLECLISSNSLASADHVHAYAFSFKNKKKYLKDFRWQIFELRPDPKDADLMITPVNKEERVGGYITCIHAKTYVVDGQAVWVGSFNLDPRSANLNTEAGLIIDDEGVAQAIEKNIRRDMAHQNSWTIGRRPKVPVVSRFSRPLGNIIRAIPVVDVWPFTYSGCFELKEGRAVVPFYHEDFYGNYRYVGPFPGVMLSEKEIKARLIKAFLGPAEPLI